MNDLKSSHPERGQNRKLIDTAIDRNRNQRRFHFQSISFLIDDWRILPQWGSRLRLYSIDMYMKMLVYARLKWVIWNPAGLCYVTLCYMCTLHEWMWEAWKSWCVLFWNVMPHCIHLKMWACCAGDNFFYGRCIKFVLTVYSYFRIEKLKITCGCHYRARDSSHGVLKWCAHWISLVEWGQLWLNAESIE